MPGLPGGGIFTGSYRGFGPQGGIIRSPTKYPMGWGRGSGSSPSAPPIPDAPPMMSGGGGGGGYGGGGGGLGFVPMPTQTPAMPGSESSSSMSAAMEGLRMAMQEPQPGAGVIGEGARGLNPNVGTRTYPQASRILSQLARIY